MQFVSRIFRYICLLFTVKEVPPSFHERIDNSVYSHALVKKASPYICIYMHKQFHAIFLPFRA